MSGEIEENLKLCDEILDRFAKLSDSDANEQNTWLALGELESQTIALKTLYKQIIPPKKSP